MTRPLTADEFDAMFDAGEEVIQYMKVAPRPEPVIMHLDIEASSSVAASLDEAAYEQGMTRSEYVYNLIMADRERRELTTA